MIFGPRKAENTYLEKFPKFAKIEQKAVKVAAKHIVSATPHSTARHVSRIMLFDQPDSHWNSKGA